MHVPVLTEKVIEYLNVKSNRNFIDCTLGSGAHTSAIVKHNRPAGKVLAIDWDREAITRARSVLSKPDLRRITFVEDNFSHLEDITKREKFHASGVLLDLGMSSDQLELSKRGFSFQKNEPLDMRYSLENPLTAAKIVNYWSKNDITRMLKEYGQEQFANQIAEAITKERKEHAIARTQELVKVITGAVPGWYRRRKIHPATKTFQALRIEVNNELENLKAVIPQVFRVLGAGGRVVIISFHSLEDRIVKYAFKENPQAKILTKKVIIPSIVERETNPRARSAKLRAAEKL
ncbi:MAG: 16S rRNA (cytosine1402-N4)-methyltransferase [Parcubacteria group bacterium Greene0714_21]|nr:MAG: 16S rRNA (cytosine1402-N4)-methyltransferase [Parcubacteria group bacterium Greene0416_39]TSC97387.1 MAG: 16S rRNA (cytosine1402-N4)-methyltransferase [Parcubacteria group bacterium Greene1014_47]TSD03864.1 MAG: 16S rRNA (cytosine1402-N4)-methyltransferase [Parcubacteria group bacterium Greene0714_21]